MVKLYERIPENIRWFLFIPLWLLVGYLNYYLLKLLIFSVSGEMVTGQSVVGFSHAFISICVMYFLIPNAKMIGALAVCVLNVLMLAKEIKSYNVSLLDVGILTDINMYTSPAIGPYSASVVGAALSCLFLKKIA